MWYQFFDMHSGGGQKEDWPRIYIEADSEKRAISAFYSRFGHNPQRVTCTCCGEDYAIYEGETLEEVSEYDRGALDVETYKQQAIKHDAAYFMPKESVSDFEYECDVPEEGYYWAY